MDYVLLIIGLLVGVVIGYLLAKSMKSANSEIEQEKQRLLVENAQLKSTLERTESEIKSSKEQNVHLEERYRQELQSSTEWKSKFHNMEEKLQSQEQNLKDLQTKFTKDFELVANKILEEKTNKFTDQNKKNLDAILSPLKEKITDFQKKVEDTNEKNVERSASLDKHLRMLHDLNKEITQETRTLTQALRGDSKAQGNWGEFQLEAILEKAGLQKEIHYTKETNLKTEDGANQRLDYIINLPDGKKLILDSKVSLTAYSKYHEAQDDTEKATYLKEHLLSVNSHLKVLGDKDYQKLHGINTPDYVLMFVANEPALTLALKEDMGLFDKALDKNIVLVSVSTLLATLRTISFIWKQDLQNKNAEEIATQAGNLYDKFVGFAEDLKKLGSQMETANKTYQAAMNKMSEGSGNLVRRAEKLKKLGVNPSKNIDQKLLDQAQADDE